MRASPHIEVLKAAAEVRREIQDAHAALDRITYLKKYSNTQTVEKPLTQTDACSEATILLNEGEHKIGYWQDIVLVTWGGKTHVKHVKELHEQLRKKSNKMNNSIALVQLLYGSIENLADDAREAFCHLLTDQEVEIKCSAVFFEGSGFRAAAFRSIITSLGVLLGLSFPHVAFKQIAQMSWWVTEQLRGTSLYGSEQMADKLEQVIRNFRNSTQTPKLNLD